MWSEPQKAGVFLGPDKTQMGAKALGAAALHGQSAQGRLRAAEGKWLERPPCGFCGGAAATPGT